MSRRRRRRLPSGHIAAAPVQRGPGSRSGGGVAGAEAAGKRHPVNAGATSAAGTGGKVEPRRCRATIAPSHGRCCRWSGKCWRPCSLDRCRWMPKSTTRGATAHRPPNTIARTERAGSARLGDTQGASRHTMTQPGTTARASTRPGAVLWRCRSRTLSRRALNTRRPRRPGLTRPHDTRTTPAPPTCPQPQRTGGCRQSARWLGARMRRGPQCDRRRRNGRSRHPRGGCCLDTSRSHAEEKRATSRTSTGGQASHLCDFAVQPGKSSSGGSSSPGGSSPADRLSGRKQATKPCTPCTPCSQRPTASGRRCTSPGTPARCCAQPSCRSLRRVHRRRPSPEGAMVVRRAMGREAGARLAPGPWHAPAGSAGARAPRREAGRVRRREFAITGRQVYAQPGEA
jgi:hypothetical protein